MNGHQQPANSTTHLIGQPDVNFALQAAEVGTWDLDIINQRVWWDERCKELYGFDQDDVVPYEQVLFYIHPDDRLRVDAAVQWALDPQSGGRYDIQFRTIGATNGQLRWLHCRGRAFFNEQPVAYRFSGIAQDVTELVNARRDLGESERFARTIITHSPVAQVVFTGPAMIIRFINARMLDLLGQDESMIGKPFLEAIPSLAGTQALSVLQQVYQTGQLLHQSQEPYSFVKNGALYQGYYDLTYQPLQDESGRVYGIINTAVEVTEQVEARQKIKESEQNLRRIIAQAPVAMNISRGPNHLIELANERMFALWGREPQTVLNKPTFEVFPEAIEQGFKTILDHIYSTGETYRANELTATLTREGVPETIYLNLVYEPLREEDGTVIGIMQVATEVTEQVLTQRAKAEAEVQLQTIIRHLPSATVVFRGRNLVVESPSKNFIDIIDRGPNVTGKPLGELMPELESQSYLAVLDEVYTSGQTFRAYGTPVDIRQQDGTVTRDFFDLIYTPLVDTQGQVYAILSVATNVTEVMKAQRQLEENKAWLENAIELAELGTFSVDMTTNLITVSPRVADWFGFADTVADADTFIKGISQRDRHYVRSRLYHTLSPESGGRFDVVHSVIHAKTGRQVIVHALGQLYLDSRGLPLKIEGTAQDITAQQELQVVLEQQVHQRTQELAMTNEKLVATNEDLATVNQDLIRSNQNLEQFAYIASHDLQEPLRKIQQFGDLLKTRLADSINREELIYLERMQVAASRMSVLIKDLLTFSRIATTQAVAQSVRLTDVVSQVLENLSVLIEESGAQITIDELPVVQGDQMQLSQLFQNLLSNALKFRRTNPAGDFVRTQIGVRVRLLSKHELPASVKPARFSETYYQIEVIDNGIGFDEKYLDRIFQVFQRLHGKNEFAGTGVGLAIVQKVVTNHGGAITAHGKPNQGATFCVYLPF